MILPATLTLGFGTAYVDAGGVKFDYLEVTGNTAVTTYKAKYSLRVDDSFSGISDVPQTLFGDLTGRNG